MIFPLPPWQKFHMSPWSKYPDKPVPAWCNVLILVIQVSVTSTFPRGIKGKLIFQYPDSPVTVRSMCRVRFKPPGEARNTPLLSTNTSFPPCLFPTWLFSSSFLKFRNSEIVCQGEGIFITFYHMNQRNFAFLEAY